MTIQNCESIHDGADMDSMIDSHSSVYMISEAPAIKMTRREYVKRKWDSINSIPPSNSDYFLIIGGMLFPAILFLI